jgi:hypothetical protein
MQGKGHLWCLTSFHPFHFHKGSTQICEGHKGGALHLYILYHGGVGDQSEGRALAIVGCMKV